MSASPGDEPDALQDGDDAYSKRQSLGMPLLKKGQSYTDDKKRVTKGDSSAALTIVKPDEDEEDEDDPDDDGGTKWVDAIQSTEAANELFGLFSALGNAGGRGSNAMNRNPLPRGRACESADWVVDLFKFLPPTTGSCGVPSIRVPLTLTLRHSRPHTWYFSPKRGGVVEAAASTDSEETIARFVNAAAVEAALLDLEGQVDIIAMYVSTVRFTKDGVTKARTRTEYFDEELLRDFLVHRATKRDGILQLFVIPTGNKSSCVRARFVGTRLATVETRTNVNYITDSTKTVLDRAVTFDGEEHLARTGNMPSTSALFAHINKLLREVLTHVNDHTPDTYCIGEATAYFRVHADSKLYFLQMPSLLLLHAVTQKPTNPEAAPLSPRVAKPVLAYSGSLPKDYFRCPCCGRVVAAVDRAQVPYAMVLQHLELLDAADGTMDGDSEALREIALTLDKVGRNPQYYAELYRAAAKANPTSNVLSLLQQCGYPGGDLELDDKLESPAELICFRLLQLAVAGLSATSGSGGGGATQQLSIAHYKWVRDHKPKLLHRVRVFVCSECSLDFSRSLASTHTHSAAAALTADSALFEAPPTKAPPAKLPKDGRSVDASAAPPSVAATLRGEEEELMHDTRTEAELRRALSLPLLKPKVDRAKAARQRPWRTQASDSDAVGERKPRTISEEPRFAPVTALRGVQPKPDPKFLPSLQHREAAKASEMRRLSAREVGQAVREANAATVSQLNARREQRRRAAALLEGAAPGWDEADEVDGEGATFLTTSASATALGVTRGGARRGGARRGGRRQPPYQPSGPVSGVTLPRIDTALLEGNGAAEAGSKAGGRHRSAQGDAAAGRGDLDAQLSALDARMATLEKGMRPVVDSAEQREQAQLAADEKLHRTLQDIRAKLLEDLPRVLDMFRKFDRNGDGQISRTEFGQVLPLLQLPQYGPAEMNAMFDVLDIDRSGSIDFRELQKLLRRGADVQLAAVMQVGAVAVETEARNRYKVRTHARDGRSRALKQASVEEMRATLVAQAARVVDFLRQLDIDGDSRVSRAELRAALPLLGFGAGGIPAIDALFEELDMDKNGTIEYAELATALRRDDIELAPELRDGARGKIETEARNAIALRPIL